MNKSAAQRDNMTTQIQIVVFLTFVIHMIITLSYSVRIVGVRTRRIAVSFALFNVLVLVSRTANSFQAPLLAKYVETNLDGNTIDLISAPFRWIILSASFASIVGGLLIPSFQRVFSIAVTSFSEHRSIPRLILHAFTKGGIRYSSGLLTLPSTRNITQFTEKKQLPIKILVYNMFAVAILTIGVLSSLYAGYLNPEFRATSSSLSGIINGLATILMFVFIDPYLSVHTDDVIDGKCSESYFRRVVVALVASRFIGTLIAQIIFVPAAKIIAMVSTLL